MDKIIFYSNGSDELCYDLEYWENELDEFLSEEENTIDFIELEEMKYDKHKYATKWCTLHQEFLDGDECSKAECKEYTPANGARGKCKFKTFTLIGTGVKHRLFKDKFERVEKPL